MPSILLWTKSTALTVRPFKGCLVFCDCCQVKCRVWSNGAPQSNVSKGLLAAIGVA
jgi:hypothetical protein